MGIAGIFVFLSAASIATARPKVLIVLTSHDQLGPNADDSKGKTGWYLPEAAHPYQVFKDNNIGMTFASPKGGEAPLDQSSVKPYKKDKVCKNFLKNPVWKETVKLEDVDADEYDAIFVVGGYGVMWDLVGSKDLQTIAKQIWHSKGIVSGVCHGPAALASLPFVKNKQVACFSNEEEDVMQRKDVVPKTCEALFAKAGAKYSKTKPWGEKVAVAGRLITGQNPGSAKATALAVVQALKHSDEKVDMSNGVISTGIAPNTVAPVALAGSALVLVLAALRFARSRTQGSRGMDIEEPLESGTDIGLE